MNVLIVFCVIGAIAAASVTGSFSALLSNPLEKLPWTETRFAQSQPSDAALWPPVFTSDDTSNVEEVRAPGLKGIAGALGGWICFFVGLAGLVTMLRMPGEVPRAGRLILAIWFASGLFLSFQGSRFVLMILPAFGFALAAAIGAIARLLERPAARIWPSRAGLAQVVATAGLLPFIAFPVLSGYSEARGYLPAMNSAWWTALSEVRRQSKPDAIVVSWWDYGYWTEYIAARRVLADGGSLKSHAPYWTAKALLAPSEEESAGLLRMIECGGPTRPLDKLRNFGIDSVAAHRALMATASLARQPASDYFERLGLKASQIEDILALTHCSPPGSYLVLTSTMIDMPAWRYQGNWNFGAQAGPGLQEGTTGESASAMSAGYLSDDWLPCFFAGQNQFECPMENLRDVALSPTDSLHAIFLQPGARPRASLQVRSPGGQFDSITPGLVLVASAGDLTATRDASSRYPALAVLFDADKRRVLAGPASLITSTLTRLMFLGRGYSRIYEKSGVERGYCGEQVSTWKIDWKLLGESGQQPDKAAPLHN